MFNGERFVLMYTDALTEITFIVPSSSSHSQYIHIWTSVITGSVVGPVPFSYFSSVQFSFISIALYHNFSHVMTLSIQSRYRPYSL